MNASVKKLVECFLLAVALGAVAASAQTAKNAVCLPLWFEAGQGQAGMTAPFVAHGPDSAFFMTETNARIVLRKASGETAATSMQFVGGNATARIAGEDEMASKVNYLVGSSSSQWRTGVPVYGRVRVDSLYPGVNVVYYGNGRQLEYDFDLAAGVDPKTIAMRFDGAEKVSVNSLGELVVSLNGGEVVQRRPVIYQMEGRTRHEISGGYQVLDAHTATFALTDYDHSLPLVIDPVLGFSTYFGGNNNDFINAVVLGTDGSIYVAGQTLSTLFTNVGTNILRGYQTNFQGGSVLGDAFVAKFAPSGTNLYFTYLGGSSDEAALGLAVDQYGHAFVTGYTDSSNFPHTTNVVQPQIEGQVNPSYHSYPSDAFVTELETNGSSLIYSTFLGGNQTDVGTSIAVDTIGNAYVVGYTASTNFAQLPKTNGLAVAPYQSTLQCSNTIYNNMNGFMAELAPGGTALKYASFFGGTNYDVALAIALDLSNNIYVAGYTASTNFPTANAIVYTNVFAVTNLVHIGTNWSWVTNSITNVYYGSHLNDSTNNIGDYDAFVAKFTPGFSNLVYSTFLGGSNTDWATGLAVDTNGFAYVVGSTASTNFPYVTTNYNFATNLSCVLTNTARVVVATNAFLAKIGWDNTRATLNYSIAFGGVGMDLATGVGLDSAGDVFVAGSAASTNFPVTFTNLTGSLRATNTSAAGYLCDVFVTAFRPDGTLIYSTYLGGFASDFCNAMAVDPAGNVYVAGTTLSTNYPAYKAIQTGLYGSTDGFLSKLSMTVTPPVASASHSSANWLISWQPVDQETPDTFVLESITNLGGSLWIPVTNAWVYTNGVYLYTLSRTNSFTNAAQFFRLHQY